MPDAPPPPAMARLGPGERTPYAIVPTAELFHELEDRVVTLEHRAGDEDTEPVGPADVAARLDRHRVELDELKSRYNGLVELLRPYFPTVPTTSPESPL